MPVQKPTVGVVGLPTVVSALAEAGFHVVTAPAFRDAAAEIGKTLGTRRIPVLTETLAEPGFLPWASSMNNRSERLVVVETQPGAVVNTSRLPESVVRMPTPVTVNDLVHVLGFEPIPGPSGAVTVGDTGQAPAPAAALAPDPEPEAAPAPVPFTRRARAQAATATQQLFDVTGPAPDAPPRKPEPARQAPPVNPYSTLFDVTDRRADRDNPGNPYARRFDVNAPAPAPDPLPPQPAAPTGPVPLIPGKTGLGDVIVVSAPKGGVWKTTTALQLAAAAADAGKNVVLIDANRGQGDIRTALRLPSTAPGVIAAVGGDASDAILTPSVINNHRKGLAPVRFAVVLSPLRAQASPEFASAQIYARVLRYARSIADLVIVDTQIVEGHKTDLFTGFVIPALRSGGWLLSITTEDYSNTISLAEAYTEFTAAGVTLERSLLIATRWPDFTPADQQNLVSRFGSSATLVGVVGTDPAVHAGRNSGQVVYDTSAAKPVIHKVLHSVTRDAFFEPEPEPDRARFSLGGVFSRRRK